MNAVIAMLTDRDDKAAYGFAKQVAAASEKSPEYYPLVEEFATLLDNGNSYIRTRGFILCCSQARWDTEGRIKKILPDLLKLLHDPKPTVVRQCLNAIQEVAVFRPELNSDIMAELSKIDLSKYRDTMAPLIMKDMKKVEELISFGR